MIKLVGAAAATPLSHDDRILAALAERGPLSRAELCQIVGLSRATVSEIVGRLLNQGAVFAVNAPERAKRGRGRPAELLTLDPTVGYVMGLEFSHGVIHLAIANAAHDLMAEGAREHPADCPWPTRCDIAFDLIDEVCRAHSIRIDMLHGLGIGLVGPAGTARRHPGHISTWSADHDLDLYHAKIEPVLQRFGQRFSIPILVETGTKFATLAEAIWGAGEGSDDLLYVRVTEGIGGGIVLSGRLHVGPDGSAGDFGHVTVDPTGPYCRCGKRGCLEAVASAEAVIRDCAQLRPGITSLADVRDSIATGDDAVRLVVGRAGRFLGGVLASATTMINPGVIVVGGELPDTIPTYLDWARHAFATQVSTNGIRDVPILAARLGDESAAIGAIAAVFHRSSLLDGYPYLGGAPNAPSAGCRRAWASESAASLARAEEHAEGSRDGSEPADGPAAVTPHPPESSEGESAEHSQAFLDELLAVRTRIEPIAAAEAAAREDKTVAGVLLNICGRLEASIRSGNATEFGAIDAEFHTELLRGATNTSYRRLADTASVMLAEHQRIGHVAHDATVEALHLYREVAQAIACGEPQRAQAASRALIEYSASSAARSGPEQPGLLPVAHVATNN